MLLSTMAKTVCVRTGAMMRLWHKYKEERLERMRCRSFMIACASCVRFVDSEGKRGRGRGRGRGGHRLTFVRFQAEPAVFSSNTIIHLVKVYSCKALRVVADFQLPSHTVCRDEHEPTNKLNTVHASHTL